ncbi:small conductance mechanosensitive channel [Thermomonospora echinospora]|uniref:Small conductance mechanosensitive channel n=1 Tax=Thermomonospora echinospora TaxID=1992 RepID=A0A1H6B626_9ACTN|nr:mechanosensitive ion channel family protein [Thermomonospora echinospora]SEG55576.1 small conductance mechanosensitive channel [Thermomonospora echinospora]
MFDSAALWAAAPLFDTDERPETYCGEKPLMPCRLFWNITHSPDATKFVKDYHLDLWTNRLFVIVLTLSIALLLRRFAHGMITKITARMAEGTMPERLRERSRTAFDGSHAVLSERRRQRAKTLGSVLRSIASIVIMGTAVFSALGELGLNLAPILASASVIGVAVGFGAQNIVKDFLAGLFMLLEDQFGVGDVVDLGPAKGTVEAVTLRVTRIRDVNGVVWYIRNGEIMRVGNESQNWARAVLDIPVDYGEDTAKVKEVLKATADRLADDPAWKEIILEEPSVWGVQGLTGEAVVVRLVVKTAPGRQGEVARELRERVKRSFDDAGVTVATPPPA